MKKLNESVLRKLIMETLGESSITEGKKKKRLREVDPVPQPDPTENPEQDVAYGMEAEPQPQDFMPNEENIVDAIKKALEIARNKNPVVAAGARGMLKDLFKQIEQSLPGDESD